MDVLDLQSLREKSYGFWWPGTLYNHFRPDENTSEDTYISTDAQWNHLHNHICITRNSGRTFDIIVKHGSSPEGIRMSSYFSRPHILNSKLC